ncbi:MAG: hypothetical protein MI739_01645 [Bacteroidales bacterium]|nr:hypothetical protein [Bacteroidales bacterium]
MQNKISIKYILLIFPFLFLIACDKTGKIREDKRRQTHEIDTSTILVKYSNNLFTLPSPYQITYSIKNQRIEFNKSLLNPADNVSNYVTNFRQALNIGIYGTDLGYLNIYKQIPDVISYFTVIKKLSRELGLENTFQKKIIDRIEQNIDNQDSLLNLITSTYRQFDSYLKKNNRKDIGVLILTGGWIESTYILSQSALSTSERQVINRLGEQKHPLNSLIEILSPFYYKSKEYTELIDALVDLAYEFDGIIYNYTYLNSNVKPNRNLTIINSKSNVVISEYHLKTISNKVSSIRNKIIY